MAQPPKYDRQHDFAEELETTHGAHLDDEFDTVKVTADALRENLGKIQRDDGALRNGIVTPDTLSRATLALVSKFNPTGVWKPATKYKRSDVVEHLGTSFVALENHVSEDFSADREAGHWLFLSADPVPVIMAVTYEATAGQDTFALPAKAISKDLIFATVDASALPGADYALAESGETITLTTPLVGGETVELRVIQTNLMAIDSYSQAQINDLFGGVNQALSDKADAATMAQALAEKLDRDQVGDGPLQVPTNEALGAPPRTVASIAELRALTATNRPVQVLSYHAANVLAYAGGGWFDWLEGDQSAHVAADPLGGIYVSSESDPVGSGGCWRRRLEGVVTPQMFGAVADDTGVDSSVAIRAALAATSHVVTPQGVYRCDEMIELGVGQTLQLGGGATLRRFAAHSASTDPVVWIKGSNSSLCGAGQAASFVMSENRAPKGVVRLGHKDMTESHDNVTYCTLQGITISGATAYGQTTGNPDVALYIPNPQLGAKANYFHNIFGIRVQHANFGIYLHGWANGNTISNIQGYQIGNTALGPNANAFIYAHGALDNAVSNCFFHRSPDSIGLLVDDCDNTENGGEVHRFYANSFSGFVCEQGGAAAVALKSLISTGNSFYEIRANTALGTSLPAGFTDNNVVISLNSVHAGPITGAVVKGAVVEGGDVRATGSFRGGSAGNFHVAKKAKMRAHGGDAASITFTLSHTAVTGIWRFGYVRLTVAGGDRGNASSPVAWYVYSAKALGTSYPSLGNLKDSGGDVEAFTITDVGGGVIEVVSAQDDIVSEMEYGFTASNVNVA